MGKRRIAIFSNLQAEMVRNGITQSDMAEFLNMNERTVGTRMSGDSSFSVWEMWKIKKEYFPEHTLEYLFHPRELGE